MGANADREGIKEMALRLAQSQRQAFEAIWSEDFSIER
jgi:hypothetical protein